VLKVHTELAWGRIMLASCRGNKLAELRLSMIGPAMIFSLAGMEHLHNEQRRPQFGLRGLFALITWTAAIAGLAVSRLAAWTMLAVTFSLVAVNCAGQLKMLQSGTGQARVFCLGWILLGLSLFLPAVRGCGNERIAGWKAAMICGRLAIDPPADRSMSKWKVALVYGWLTFGNLLLLFSPLWFWQVRHARGRVYGSLLTTTVALFCVLPIGESNPPLVGYYFWCAAGLTLSCASRPPWATMALMALAVIGMLSQ
jgi:hypothetical protein